MAIPPFTISAKAINLIADISALIERHNIALEGENALKLRKINRIKTIHSSLAIEGNTLSEDEVKDIINGKQVVAPIRQIQEVKNAISVYDIYSRLNPFSEKDLLKAHGIMMNALTKDAGKYRNGGVGVFGERGLIHMAPPPQIVPELMGNLFQWLKNSKDHLLIRSCVFHYEFEFIHPFSDGNGRTGRLWQSLILGKLNPLFEYLPVENMVYANQEEYYNAIAESTKEGQSGPFIDFMLNEILTALKNNIKEKVPNKIPNKIPNKVPNKIPDKVPNKSELSILTLLIDNPHLTRIDIAHKTGLSENGVKRILANMKSRGWIERKGSNKTGYWIVNIW
ncbi:MAG: Fic family protein [Muribaculaceae bacterium]|nr:Fic family protein [Muribaculaceae bacterium]MDE6754397.1 Fic family protein [Muribaculaceae bacterium]